jgi:WD40 repeat protein
MRTSSRHNRRHHCAVLLLSLAVFGLSHPCPAEVIKAFSGVEGNTVAFSRDGKLAVLGGQRWEGEHHMGVARVVSLATSKETFSVVRPGAFVESAALSSDSRLLALALLGDHEMRLGVWDVVRREQVAVLHSKAAPFVEAIDFSPDGAFLAAATKDVAEKPVVILWDTKTFRKSQLLYDHTSTIYDVRFSPDGKWLASGGRDKQARVWNVKTGKLKATLGLNADDIDRIVLSADSKMVAYACSDNAFALWELEPEPRRMMDRKREVITSLAFHPTGKWLLCGGFDRSPEGPIVSTVQIWSVKDQRLVGEKNASKLPATSCAVSPNGKKVLSTSHDGATVLWDFPAELLEEQKKLD